MKYEHTSVAVNSGNHPGRLLAQSYGPPAMMPAPMSSFKCTTWNCWAMNPPDESPETDMAPRSIL